MDAYIACYFEIKTILENTDERESSAYMTGPGLRYPIWRPGTRPGRGSGLT